MQPRLECPSIARCRRGFPRRERGPLQRSGVAATASDPSVKAPIPILASRSPSLPAPPCRFNIVPRRRPLPPSLRSSAQRIIDFKARACDGVPGGLVPTSRGDDMSSGCSRRYSRPDSRRIDFSDNRRLPVTMPDTSPERFRSPWPHSERPSDVLPQLSRPASVPSVPPVPRR